MNKETTREVATQYLAMPEALRPKSFKAYVESLGINVHSSHYAALKEPKVIRKALQMIGLTTFGDLQDVMKALTESAKNGNVRAADVLLRHVRELVTMADEKDKMETPLHRMIEDTAKVAAELNVLADSLERGGVIRRAEAVEAEVVTEDVPRGTLGKTADKKQTQTAKGITETQSDSYDGIMTAAKGDLILKAPPHTGGTSNQADTDVPS